MKKMFKNLLVVIFTISLLLSPLTACSRTDTPPIKETEPPAIDYTQFPYVETPGAITINGTPISEYRIVIPENCDLYTKYAAQNLRDYLKYNADIELEIVTDTESVVEYEIVIGNTNRAGSVRASTTVLGDGEYILMMEDTSIVVFGNGYLVGAGAGDLMYRRAAGAWRGYDIDISDIPTDPTPISFSFEQPNNAILLIGDGMGHNHINMTMQYGMKKFSAADMPNVGEIITQSQSVIDKKADYTDSAAAGTALATGFKTTNTFVGVDPKGKKLVSLRELANAVGAKTAILSTALISDATPATFLAHCNDRWSATVIQKEIDQVIKDGKVDYAIGSLTDDLVDVSANALHSISSNGSNFFTMIEEGYIDKNAHSHNVNGVVHTVKRFNDLITYCMEFVMFHPDTVIIVTADHETGGLTKRPNVNKYVFTYDNHTNANVPIYAIGVGTEIFAGVATDNTRVPHFIAKIFGDDNFGDPNIK